MKLIRCVLASVAVMSCGSCFHDPFNLLQGQLEWIEIESEHFIYHYQDSHPDDIEWHDSIPQPSGAVFNPNGRTMEETAQMFVDLYEWWYTELKGIFETEPAGKINVFQYYDAQEQATYAQGTAGNFIDYHKPDGTTAAIHSCSQGACPHELIHIFESAVGSAPVFLMEGLAIALDGETLYYNSFDQFQTHYMLPTLPTAGYPVPMLPWLEQNLSNGDWADFPLHQLAAITLGLYENPDWPVPATTVYPHARPSNMISWSNFISSGNSLLAYTVGGSFVHYLVSLYGWENFIRLYRSTCSTGLAGPVLSECFKTVYAKTLPDLEEEWISYLRTRPAAFFSIPPHITEYAEEGGN
jgi:hypothetical protein